MCLCAHTHTDRIDMHTYKHTHTHTLVFCSHISIPNCSNFLSETTLQRFQYVRVIRGQLQISGWNRSIYPSLPMVIDYFRNVEYIGSLNLTLNTVNTVGDALVISTNPGLERVDLSRLRAVRYGNVRVRRNPELCYVGDFQTTTNSNSVYLTEAELILPNDPEPNFKSVEACSTFHSAIASITSSHCLLQSMMRGDAVHHM